MNEYEPILNGRLKNAPREVKDAVADIMIDAILSSEGIPEESKIEVRIMRAYKDVEALLDEIFKGYSRPIPPTEEGKKVQAQIYPARKEFLDYLLLMKVGLESFVAANPIPDIPPQFRRAVQEQLDRY